MPPGNLATLDELLQHPARGRLSKNLLAVAWVHRGVAIPVKNDCRSREPRPRLYRAAGGGLAEPHSVESRRHIMGGTACQPGVHSDGSVEIGIRGSHDRGRSAAG